MKTIKVETKIEDMKRWNASEDPCCPIKYAIERATGMDRHTLIVSSGGFMCLNQGQYYHFQWSDEIRNWIEALDNKREVEPITFEMEVP